IRAYIARDSAYYAACHVQRIADAVKALKQFPELGPMVPEFERYVVREHLVQNYRVFYTIREDRIVILAVVHAARDIGSIILSERK
ncbi:MAG: type II toxin-antitoxin system RelE/ParE family toxin, partial [Thermoguttaceae bacterium]